MPEPAAAPCSGLADDADELIAQLESAVQAIAALDPASLQAIVDGVERLHAWMQAAAHACRAAAEGG